MPPPLRRFAASAPPEAIVAAIREDGGCIVEKMFDASTIAAMRDAVLEKARTSADGVPGSATFGYSTAAETRTEAAQEAGPHTELRGTFGAVHMAAEVVFRSGGKIEYATKQLARNRCSSNSSGSRPATWARA